MGTSARKKGWNFLPGDAGRKSCAIPRLSVTLTELPASNSRQIPNVPAARYYTAQDNGLVQPWEGRVFLNPPFGPGVDVWFSRADVFAVD